MFTFFENRSQYSSPVQVANTTFSFLFLALSMVSLSPLVEAQRGGGGRGGGGGFGGGGGHGYVGGGGHGTGSVSCDNCLLAVGGIAGGAILLGCMLFAVIICIASDSGSQIDEALISDCPHNDPQKWITSADVRIPVSMADEDSNIIEHLKRDPQVLNERWEATYNEPGESGNFNPELRFEWDEETNWMTFKTVKDEQDAYGKYRIINGMFSFENGRFVAHKEYFGPSQQTVPYTIVQAGHIDFVSKDEQTCITARGCWYSTYDNSVKGTFKYNKTVTNPTVTDQYASYGTFNQA